MITTIQNPYFEEIKHGVWTRNGKECLDYEKRAVIVEKYAWAIPNDKAITALAKLSPIVEIGAGKGYWARLIVQAGGDIVCYDNHSRGYKSDWFNVQTGSPRAVLKHTDRNLFLCWPEYGTRQASHAARLFLRSTAQYLIYVGEGPGGCTGNAFFHKLMEIHFDFVEVIEIPQWYGINDFMYIYKKK
jgi:hypothetical protein